MPEQKELLREHVESITVTPATNSMEIEPGPVGSWDLDVDQTRLEGLVDAALRMVDPNAHQCMRFKWF